VLDHLADLESDFSRYHRVDDIYALDGPRFFRMAWRLSVYGGVMAMRVEAQREAQNPEPRTGPAPRTTAQPAARGHRGQKVVPLAAFMSENPGLVERR
jgi:hypothetical protein